LLSELYIFAGKWTTFLREGSLWEKFLVQFQF
jgi:hypothetical protein